VLSAAERIVQNYTAQHRRVMYQKAALMQQLLTGKRRVKLESAVAPVAVNG
jgi:hypothetical protein